MSRRFVVNASPLILLARTRQLRLLDNLAEEVLVPGAVMDELRAGGPHDETAVQVASTEWVRCIDDLPLPPEIWAWDLGIGESQVLAHALRDLNLEAVLDDRAARRCASALGILCTGTLGIVLACKHHRHIPTARPVIDQLRANGMYITDELIEAALAEVGE